MYDLNKIKEYLNTKFVGDTIIQFEELSSTSVKAKNIYNTCPSGTVVLAENQTKAKVRFGREWICLPDRNIYLSIIIKDSKSISSVYEVISLVSALQGLKENIICNIKWPNDLLFNDKKVCSIALDKINKKNNEGFIISFFINVNVSIDELDINLKKEATSLLELMGSIVDREIIISNILNSFEKYYEEYLIDKSTSEAINMYRDYLLKNEIYISKYGKKTLRTVIVKNVDDEGNLIILNESSHLEILKSGEITLENDKKS